MKTHTHVTPKDVLVELPAGQFRSISTRVERGHIDIENLSPSQNDNWGDNLSNLIGPGEVTAFAFKSDLIPSRMIGAMGDWLSGRKMYPGMKIDDGVDSPTLLSCLGASFHSDASNYPDSVFAVVWLEEDADLDLFFPHTKDRVELRYGTVVLFDSCLTHGVVRRGKETFAYQDFAGDDRCSGFASFDISVHNASVAKFMGIEFLDNDKVSPDQIVMGLKSDRLMHEIDIYSGDWAVLDKGPDFSQIGRCGCPCD
jgi:hypothetical protein